VKHHRCLPLLAAFIAAAGCTNDPVGTGGPGPVPTDSLAADSSLTFLRPALSAPPLADRLVSFWAVRGQTREVRLMYRPAAGRTDSVEFARFRVDDRSLVNDSAGHPIAQGDSLLITLGVADSLRLITEFHPSGLVFLAGRPARLWLKFGEADPDLNHDGLVTAADTTILLGLTIWKQEQVTDPWTLLPSAVDTVSQEVEADIPGFTRFAVAY
jgi:hypothetical protein